MGTETAGVATAQTTTGNSAEGSAALAAERLFNDWIQTGAEAEAAGSGEPGAAEPQPKAEAQGETALSQQNQDRPQPEGELSVDSQELSETTGESTDEPKEAAREDEEAGSKEREAEKQKPEASDEPEWFQKRIGKEVKKRKELEEQLAELKAKLENRNPEAEAGAHKEVASVPSNDPVEAVPEVREAKQELAKHSSIKATANELLKQLRQDPDAVAQRLQQAQVKLRDYSEDTIRDYLESAKEEAMTQAAAATARLTLAQERAKAAVQAQRQQAEQLSIKEFPDLADPDSELSRQVDAVMSNRPWLKNDPFGRFSAAAAVDRILKAQQKVQGQASRVESKTKAEAPKPLPKMPSATAAVPAPSKPKQTTGVENIVAVAGDPEKRDRAIEDFFKRW